ncbi:MAG: phosphate ABC transporter substrate-binding protein [Eggerthellaceae bacterium]|jgi:phosphate transport system substrate-binding protein
MSEEFEIKQMSRRSFLGALGAGSIAVASLGLFGCSSSSSSSASSSSAASSASASSASASAKKLSGSITAVGSTALQPLVEAAAEQFMQENAGVQITVQGGGSGQGITQISQGAVQIGNSDVFAETKITDSATLAKIKDNQVCVVGMGPVANKSCGVTNLTMEQLQGIFTGSITNWSEVGGADQDIVVLNRASGSGTRATFEDAVLKGVTVPESFKPQEQDSSGTVAKMVAETPGTISYLAFSYFDDTMTALQVDGVDPKDENVESNTWKIWAYEHMYTAASPDEVTSAFIEYMMGSEVQGTLVPQTGYIASTGMKVKRDASGNVTNL